MAVARDSPRERLRDVGQSRLLTPQAPPDIPTGPGLALATSTHLRTHIYANTLDFLFFA